MDRIPFNRPHLSGGGQVNLAEVLASTHLAGDGPFTRKCHAWLEAHFECHKALLTHSCTAALEIAALASDVAPGDEVILPSYTFVSTANAFALRGAVPVFVDIRPDTLNLDERQIEAAITSRTRAIVPVHYAGVPCAMEPILDIARRNDLLVIEDAAQAIWSRYRDRPAGSLGHAAALSFHETKNVISGEGGALVVNLPGLAERAEIVREKGTNRSQFFRGQVDKYTWVSLGSSYLPSEIIAAVLAAQLAQVDAITTRRLAIWNRYHDAFEQLERDGRVRRPTIPDDCRHNGHIYRLLLRDLDERTAFIEFMAARDIQCTFHYVPLHSSPFGRRLGRPSGALSVTDDIADRLVRLPVWPGIEVHLERVVESALAFFGAHL